MIWASLAFWYLQDLFQVIFGGWAVAPDLFLTYLLSKGLTDERDYDIYLWGCFIGGLLWDLRWTGIPGFSASLYGAIFMVFRLLWTIIPKEGRVPALFLGFSSSALAVSAVARLLLFYSGRPVIGSATVVFVLLTLLSIAISWGYYSRFYRGQNV